jgi:hypothetical protein
VQRNAAKRTRHFCGAGSLPLGAPVRAPPLARLRATLARDLPLLHPGASAATAAAWVAHIPALT